MKIDPIAKLGLDQGFDEVRRVKGRYFGIQLRVNNKALQIFGYQGKEAGYVKAEVTNTMDSGLFQVQLPGEGTSIYIKLES